jgi:hypothetical protein
MRLPNQVTSVGSFARIKPAFKEAIHSSGLGEYCLKWDAATRSCVLVQSFPGTTCTDDPPCQPMPTRDCDATCRTKYQVEMHACLSHIAIGPYAHMLGYCTGAAKARFAQCLVDCTL